MKYLISGWYTTERECVQWYLDMNSGGVLHTEQEIERVRAGLSTIKD